jgi:hypothetical protein
MPDTGLPWEIPYAAPADLVRDWPALSEDVADAVADALDTRKFGQIVQTVKSDDFTTSSTSFTSITGLSAAITPVSATSKVLVLVTLNGHGTANSTSVYARLMRDSTPIALGDTAGSRTRATVVFGFSPSGTGIMQSATAVSLDSPNSAVSVTYSVEVRVGAGSAFINRTQDTSDASGNSRTQSTITLIEVAA